MGSVNIATPPTVRAKKEEEEQQEETEEEEKEENKLASSKLRWCKTTTHPATYSLTGVKCRATSVAKNMNKRITKPLVFYLERTKTVFFVSGVRLEEI